ncbi:MAG TPA: hypothetical protein VE377_19570 [Candidatus Dormibacteraeota bacterium]|nr:hypothetical protein [Candidatus Dormibacteraeota bacterium]
MRPSSADGETSSHAFFRGMPEPCFPDYEHRPPPQLFRNSADGKTEPSFTMLTNDQYAASIVEKYHITADSGSPQHEAADEIVPVLKKWGAKHLLGITPSGAYVKNTAITLSSDVDVLVSLSPVPNMEIKKIFWSLFEFMTEQNLTAHTRDVSVRVRWKDRNVDLIPAYRDPHTSGNVLFDKKTGAAVHTDVAQHVHLIANSGRQQEICALKIWRERKGLDFPSFYLELTALRALEGERFGRLADNFQSVLRYLANKFERVVVRDPANSDNIVSNDLSEQGKRLIATAAREAVYHEDLQKLIW